MSNIDLWDVADDLADLTEWIPKPGEETPADLFNDEEWLRKRMLAMRFVKAEIDRLGDAYDAEISRLENKKVRDIGDKKKNSGMFGQLAALTAQVEQYHKAVIAREEATYEIAVKLAAEEGKPKPKKRLSLTVKTPHGNLTSTKGRVSVQIHDEPKAAAWMIASGFDAMVKKETVFTFDKRAMISACTLDADDEPMGLIHEDGDRCPGVFFARSGRSFKPKPA